MSRRLFDLAVTVAGLCSGALLLAAAIVGLSVIAEWFWSLLWR
jgi:hypothetical protein